MRAMRRTLAVAMLLALAACSRVVALPSAVVRIDTADGPVRIHAEVAETDAARSRGLAGRTSLAPGEGMAFVTDHPVDDAFWMKRMAIPLSVAFWGRDGRITAMFDMAPCGHGPCRRYRPARPYVGAVEVTRGYLASRGVEVGDRVVLVR